MAMLRVSCEKCHSDAVVVTFKGMMPMKVDDPPAHVLLTIRCPKCGERKQASPSDTETPALAKRTYLSH
jgi:ribosomal protein S27E